MRAGAPPAEFEGKIAPILKKSCLECHGQDASPLPSLMTDKDLAPFTAIDEGETVKSLMATSHVHLMGMSFLFVLVSFIFALSGGSVRFRNVFILLPFLAVWVDIGSWWFTRYQPIFAHTVIVGGILMGVSLAVQILYSLYDLWLARNKKPAG